MKRFAILYFIMLITGFVFGQKFDAEVLEYQTSCVIDGTTLKTSKYMTIQINNRNGEEYGFFNIPYSKSEPITNLNASVLTTDSQEIKKLKKSDIVDRNAYTEYLYTDDLVKSFQLKHSSYPYIVKCSFTTIEKSFIMISYWSPILFEDIPTRSASLDISLPVGYKFNEYSKDVADKTTETIDGTMTCTWKASYPKPLRDEIFSNTRNFYPRVIIVPEDFKYGIEGSNSNWESFGTWVYNLSSGLDEIPEDERPVIDRLLSGITDQREKVKVLYHYLQDHTRYINVSIGIGGLKPFPASYVSVNKYGDCKALTNYMKALLKYAGIDSYYTLVKSGDQPQNFLKDITCNQFDHVILAVPLDHDTIWLENTSNINPFGYLGTFTQNRDVLLTCATGSRLMHTPALCENDVTDYKYITYDLNLDGTAKVALKNTYQGDNFETLNQLSNNFNDEFKDKIIRDAMMFDNYEVLNWDLQKKHRDTAKLVLNATLQLNKFVNPLGSDYFFSLNPVGIPSFTNPANRTLPVELPYPIVVKDTVRYNLPAGYGLKNEYIPVRISTKYGTFDLDIKSVENSVIAIKTFKINPGYYSKEEYPDFYAFIESVRKTEKSKIVIKQL